MVASGHEHESEKKAMRAVTQKNGGGAEIQEAFQAFQNWHPAGNQCRRSGKVWVHSKYMYPNPKY